MAKYSAPGIQPPSAESLRESADHHGLRLSDHQLQDYADFMADFVPAYTLIESLSEPTLPVKYPRTPGHRPSGDENTHNAWYWKCDIRGASSGILAGKKLAIKDNIAVAGIPMMNGSRVLEGYMPEFDATLVTRILDAGGQIIGKSACEDLCLSGSSCTTAKGSVLNPVDVTRTAGGSSCGSGALVASGEVDMAIGGDQGGSIRIPASWCGIVGLKPTHSLVPYSGAMAIEPSIDHLGPMARTVTEVAELLEVIAGPDGVDCRQSGPMDIPKYSKSLSKQIDGFKIAFLKEGFEKCEDNVNEVVKGVIPQLEAAGATVEWLSIPQHFTAHALWTPVTFEGAYQNMVVGEGSGVGWKGFYPTSLCEFARRGYKTMQNELSDGMKCGIMFGDYIKRNYGNYFYNKAQNLNAQICKAYDDVLDKYDVIIMPTLPYTAPTFLEPNATLREKFQHLFGMVVNTAPFDYTGHPALSLNVGHSDGLPVGGMIVGKRFGETKVLQVGYALEQQLQK